MQASYDFLRAARALLDITPGQLAEKAKAWCPVSKALGAIKVTLDARLA